jgi:hypothetical protein
MGRRRWLALVMAVLLWSTVADASIWPHWRRKPAKPAVDPRPAAAGANHRVQVRRPPEMAIGVGQSQRFTWTVTGTTKPVRMYFDNKSPEIGTLRGGNRRVVTTSGGEANTVTLTVTGLSPGVLEIDVVDTDWQSDQSERAQQIVETFRIELQRIADQIEADAGKVPVIDAGSFSGVGSESAILLLDRAERDLRISLPYRELAPFRDAVAELMREARNKIREGSIPKGMSSLTPAILLIRSGGSTQSDLTEIDVFRTVVAGVASFFRRTSENSPLAELCFVSVPERGANVLLYPKSFPSDQQKVSTDSRKTMYLGRYVIEASKPGSTTTKGDLMLLLDQQRVVECVLSQNCRMIGGPVGRCP